MFFRGIFYSKEKCFFCFFFKWKVFFFFIQMKSVLNMVGMRTYDHLVMGPSFSTNNWNESCQFLSWNDKKIFIKIFQIWNFFSNFFFFQIVNAATNKKRSRSLKVRRWSEEQNFNRKEVRGWVISTNYCSEKKISFISIKEKC